MNQQFDNQMSPGAKGYSVRIFLTPEQRKILAKAAKINKSTECGALVDAFSYMENAYLERLINGFINRRVEEVAFLEAGRLRNESR